MATNTWQNATTEIHTGYSPAGPHRPMTVPIYNSAAFEFTDYATAAELFRLKKAGFTYSRTGNPTVSVLEARAAALEGGIGALATATGQSAVAVSLLALLQGPNHLVASNKLYGGTVDLLTDTFADIVVHSATKALAGHGSVLGGLVIDAGTFDFSDAARWPQIAAPKARYYGDSLLERHGANAYLMLARSKFLHDLGPTLAPASASAILTGIETLSLRVAKAQSNVLELVAALEAHPAVARVHHPSLATHRDHGLARRDFPAGTGCVFSFDLHDASAVARVVDSVKLFALAANIGDARSLIVHPAAMTHCRLSDAQLAAAGISAGTLRVSVGLEDPADLIADLTAALDALEVPARETTSPTRESVGV